MALWESATNAAASSSLPWLGAQKVKIGRMCAKNLVSIRTFSSRVSDAESSLNADLTKFEQKTNDCRVLYPRVVNGTS